LAFYSIGFCNNTSNLGHNGFPVFPSVGLENALHIKVHNNPNLREFPLPASFPRVKTLALSYAYHCCPFQQSSSYSIINGIGGEDSSLRDSIIFPSSEHGIDLTAWARGEAVWTDSSKKKKTQKSSSSRNNTTVDYFSHF
jgi:leucine-rich repeat-containing G protein-coupled receptor 6